MGNHHAAQLVSPVRRCHRADTARQRERVDTPSEKIHGRERVTGIVTVSGTDVVGVVDCICRGCGDRPSGDYNPTWTLVMAAADCRRVTSRPCMEYARSVKRENTGEIRVNGTLFAVLRLHAVRTDQHDVQQVRPGRDRVGGNAVRELQRIDQGQILERKRRLPVRAEDRHVDEVGTGKRRLCLVHNQQMVVGIVRPGGVGDHPHIEAVEKYAGSVRREFPIIAALGVRVSRPVGVERKGINGFEYGDLRHIRGVVITGAVAGGFGVPALEEVTQARERGWFREGVEELACLDPGTLPGDLRGERDVDRNACVHGGNGVDPGVAAGHRRPRGDVDLAA